MKGKKLWYFVIWILPASGAINAVRTGVEPWIGVTAGLLVGCTLWAISKGIEIALRKNENINQLSNQDKSPSTSNLKPKHTSVIITIKIIWLSTLSLLCIFPPFEETLMRTYPGVAVLGSQTKHMFLIQSNHLSTDFYAQPPTQAIIHSINLSVLFCEVAFITCIAAAIHLWIAQSNQANSAGHEHN